MNELFLNTILLSFFITSFTMGLILISEKDKILYPLRKWCFAFGLKEQREILKRKAHINAQIEVFNQQTQEIQNSPEFGNKNLHKDISQLNEIIKNIEFQEDLKNGLDWQAFKIEAWHKPLLTCPQCMPSFWGFLISAYFVYLIGFKILFIIPFAILLAVIFNTFLSIHL